MLKVLNNIYKNPAMKIFELQYSFGKRGAITKNLSEYKKRHLDQLKMFFSIVCIIGKNPEFKFSFTPHQFMA